MKHSSLFVRSVTGLGLASLLLPIGASAATTQQLLNQAIKAQAESKRPMTMDGRMTVTGKSVLFKGNVEQGHGSANFRFLSRALAPVAGQKSPDSEGQLILEKAILHDFEKPEHLEITKPVGLEWKMVNDAFYFRAKDVPMEWAQELPEEARQYLNQWLKFAIPKELSDTSSDTNLIAPALQPQDVLKMGLGSSVLNAEQDIKARLNKLPLFLVTRTEKKMVVDGKTILRLRVILNPALITLLQNEEYKALKGMSASYRREETARINKKYTEIRTALRKFSAVMELNTTDNYVRRFEIGAKFVEPVKDCTWNDRLYKSVCKQTGRSTFELSGGFNFAPKDNQPAVEAPAASVDLMQLFTDYMKNSLGTPAADTAPTTMDAAAPVDASSAM